MLLIEIISNSSREFFEGIPRDKHGLMMNYCEMFPELTAYENAFIKTNCIELLRMKFFSCGFREFDPFQLIDDFSVYCENRRGECRKIMEVGFLEDMREFIFKFLQRQ